MFIEDPRFPFMCSIPIDDDTPDASDALSSALLDCAFPVAPVSGDDDFDAWLRAPLRLCWQCECDLLPDEDDLCAPCAFGEIV